MNKNKFKATTRSTPDSKKDAGTFSLNRENVLEILTSAVKNNGLELFGGNVKNAAINDGKLLFELPTVHNNGGRKFAVVVSEL